MAALARGERDPLGALYLRHGNAVLRLVTSILIDVPGAHAEDVCQEVFLTVRQIAPRYEEQGKFRSWLMGIAVRKARARRRKSWHRRKLLTLHSKEGMALHRPEPGADKRMEHQELISFILSKLTGDQREVFVLRAVHGLSGEEIAAALDITLDAVWSRLKRAHQTMRSIKVEVTV
jgi:RNA polymerase sigma-70 factor (ECF subfamily)